MNIFDYAQTIQGTAEQPPGTEPEPIKEKARSCQRCKVNREIADGVKAQILLDISKKENPFLMLLYASEVISRMSGDGDQFFLKVRAELLKTYDDDVLQSTNHEET